eukprot:7037427-Lingulodinium_polyedra.AAC.1
MQRYRGYHSSSAYAKTEKIRPMKAYHGLAKLMKEEYGVSTAEAEAEREHRKARPGQFRQDHDGWKGCLRARALEEPSS